MITCFGIVIARFGQSDQGVPLRFWTNRGGAARATLDSQDEATFLEEE